MTNRFLTFWDAYALANRESWFTSADNEMYDKWLTHFEAIENLTDEEILKAAIIVYNYSWIEGLEKTEAINNICYCIAKAATTVFDFSSIDIEEIENK